MCIRDRFRAVLYLCISVWLLKNLCAHTSIILCNDCVCFLVPCPDVKPLMAKALVVPCLKRCRCRGVHNSRRPGADQSHREAGQATICHRFSGFRTRHDTRLFQTGKQHNDDTLCYGSQDFARQVNSTMTTLCHGACDDTLCHGSQDFARQVNSTMMTHCAMVLRTLPDK